MRQMWPLRSLSGAVVNPLSPAVLAWLESDSPYRPAYVSPGSPKSPVSLTEDWKLLTAEDVAAWRTRHPEATCSDRAAKCLAWLELQFPITPPPSTP